MSNTRRRVLTLLNGIPMRNAAWIVCSIILFACGETEEPNPLFSVEALQGEYTIAVLVESKWDDAGERFVRRTKVWAYPYVTGTLSINSGTMSYHVKTIDFSGEATNEVALDREASVVITPMQSGSPGKFKILSKYKNKYGLGATGSEIIVWNGSILEMGRFISSTGARYRLFWLKDTN